MTTTPTTAPCEELAEGLNQSLDVLRALGSLAVQLGEQTALTSRYTLSVQSVAEVDGVAADFDVKPGWAAPWTYQATWTEGTVTVAVAFNADPAKAPADASAIDAVRAMAAGQIPGGAS